MHRLTKPLQAPLRAFDTFRERAVRRWDQTVAALSSRRAAEGSSPSWNGEPIPLDERDRIRWVEEVETARREWLGYRAYFDCVSDPELVDHAIYSVQAAERKYMYLLRQARLAGVDLGLPTGPDGAAAGQPQGRSALGR